MKGSGRTVGTGRGHRPWFGRPEAKKGGRECRPSTRGRMRRRCWRPSDTTLFNQSALPWASITNCQKWVRSLSTPAFDASPLHRRSIRRITRGSPTGRRHYDQTNTGVSNPRKSRGPTLCSVRRIHLLRMMLFYVRSVTNTSTIGRTTH